MWALVLVSFLAVYREAFETVLFYQALWLQAAPAYAAVLGGFGRRCGACRARLADLPGQRSPASDLFFGATSILLALLAVVFIGKGIAALQEAGALPIDPVNFSGLPALGIYPNVQGLACTSHDTADDHGYFCLYPLFRQGGTVNLSNGRIVGTDRPGRVICSGLDQPRSRAAGRKMDSGYASNLEGSISDHEAPGVGRRSECWNSCRTYAMRV